MKAVAFWVAIPPSNGLKQWKRCSLVGAGVEDEVVVFVVAGAALTGLSLETTNLLLQIPHPWLSALHLHSFPRL